MEDSQLNTFSVWKSSNSDEMESMLGTARQISHLSGISLKPKGRWKKEGNVCVSKFSVSPKPLKWKGTSGWERVSVIIKHEGTNASFIATIDGMPVMIGPNSLWYPIRKAADVIEGVSDRLKK